MPSDTNSGSPRSFLRLDRPRRVAPWLAGACALALAAAAPAAPPAVPATLSYQGLLLDGTGQPRTGNVDVTVRIFDALLSGALVYKQSFSAVPLADGVFTLSLGPTGDANDGSATPLTTSLATAIAGDAGPSAPSRFLELTVGSEGALVRTQILSSAYALRASSAATADNAATAQTATTAQTANDVVNVGGLPVAVITQLWNSANSDGSGPPNGDPSEGLQDTDGDGIPNYLDPDNDNDGIPDGQEAPGGINLPTPNSISLTPNQLFYTDSTVVTVHGAGFLPGLSVVFGSQTPVPSNLSSTSFQVSVGPQSPGTADIRVTNPNGQTVLAAAAFNFLSSLTNTVPLRDYLTTLALKTGTTQAVLGGFKQYGVGTGASAVFPLASRGSGAIAMAWSPSGQVAGLRCRDVNSTTCQLEILVDSNGDNALEGETPLPVETETGTSPVVTTAQLAVDPSGHWVAGYVRKLSSATAVVAHDRNGDGDFLDANEIVTVDPNPLGNGGANPSALAVDSAGRVAYVYAANFLSQVNLAWDRNNDGDFEDTVGGNPERSMLVSGATSCLGATFDDSDHLVVVWSGGIGVQLFRDLNGDGDFADAGEQADLAPGATVTACDVAKKPGQPLAVMHNGGGLKLLVDKNGDGDFADAGEVTSFPQTAGAEARLAVNGTDRSVIAVSGQLVIGTTN